MSLFILIIITVAAILVIRNVNAKLELHKKSWETTIDSINQRILDLEKKTRPRQDAKTPIALPAQKKAPKKEGSASEAQSPRSGTTDEPLTPKDVPVREIISHPHIPASEWKTQPSKFAELFSNAAQYVKQYFLTGNTVVKVGVVVLFFGVSFLVKYASDRGFLPIEFRLIGAALGGVVLTQVGWRLRETKRDFALVAQGGGIGILFITTFAAFKLYHLIPSPLAFLILAGLAGFTACMAVLQNSASFAVFGITGGFLAPILASTGQGQHVILFSYYGFLNCGILAIAWFKAWRILNLIGFAFTFIISVTWGVLKYQPHQFKTVEPFLIFFFLLYIAIPVLFARRQKPELRGYVDGSLIFGNTIISFGLQTQLVKPYSFGAAYSSLILSLFFILFCRILYRSRDSNSRLLVEAFLSLAVVFATLAIPLAFDGQWTAAVWAVEAAGIYWVSSRQNRILGRVFSSVLIFSSGIAFSLSHSRGDLTLPFLNSFYFGCLMIAAGALVASYVGSRYQEILHKNEKWLLQAFFLFGTLWWVVGGYYEIETHLITWWAHSKNMSPYSSDFPFRHAKNLSLIYISIGSVACLILSKKLNWRMIGYFSFSLIAFMFFHFLRIGSTQQRPFEFSGIISWPLAFAFMYHILYHGEYLLAPKFLWNRFIHAGTLWLLALIGSWELGWQVHDLLHAGSAWRQAANGLVPLSIIALVLFKAEKIPWPLKKYKQDYTLYGIGPIVVLTWLWFFFSNCYSAGSPAPLPYIPVINPLEITFALLMILLPLWLFRTERIKRNDIGIALGLTYFFFLNGVLMRSIHHFSGVPFRFSELFSSALAQMSLSIFWSLIAILLMIFASNKKLRWLWISGSVLMGGVVVKLFLIDLSKSGTVERIVSFLSVGLILLLVGYFSPIPPKKPTSIKEVK